MRVIFTIRARNMFNTLTSSHKFLRAGYREGQSSLSLLLALGKTWMYHFLNPVLGQWVGVPHLVCLNMSKMKSLSFICILVRTNPMVWHFLKHSVLTFLSGDRPSHDFSRSVCRLSFSKEHMLFKKWCANNKKYEISMVTLWLQEDMFW